MKLLRSLPQSDRFGSHHHLQDRKVDNAKRCLFLLSNALLPQAGIYEIQVITPDVFRETMLQAYHNNTLKYAQITPVISEFIRHWCYEYNNALRIPYRETIRLSNDGREKEIRYREGDVMLIVCDKGGVIPRMRHRITPGNFDFYRSTYYNP